MPSEVIATKSNIWRRDYSLAYTPNSMSSGAWTYGGTYGFCTAGASSAAYNCVWFLDIVPGTWTFEIWTTKTNNSGIVAFEYSLDNSNWTQLGSNVDLYSAANAISVTSVAGTVIASPTRFYFRIRSTGTKNASSAAYYFLSGGLFARRTA